jgi:hypothetical protein
VILYICPERENAISLALVGVVPHRLLVGTTDTEDKLSLTEAECSSILFGDQIVADPSITAVPQIIFGHEVLGVEIQFGSVSRGMFAQPQSNARRPTRGADSLVRFSAHTYSTKFGVYTSSNSLADGALFICGYAVSRIPDMRMRVNGYSASFYGKSGPGRQSNTNPYHG